MLVVKTSVKPSGIEGLGLFAAEDISRGTTIWKFDPRFDVYFTPEEVEKMSPLQKALIEQYGSLSKKTGKYIYSIDDARFTNHSSQNNNEDVLEYPGETEFRGVAIKDIKTGEEILVNYLGFDEASANSNGAYLKD